MAISRQLLDVLLSTQHTDLCTITSFLMKMGHAKNWGSTSILVQHTSLVCAFSVSVAYSPRLQCRMSTSITASTILNVTVVGSRTTIPSSFQRPRHRQARLLSHRPSSVRQHQAEDEFHKAENRSTSNTILSPGTCQLHKCRKHTEEGHGTVCIEHEKERPATNLQSEPTWPLTLALVYIMI